MGMLFIPVRHSSPFGNLNSNAMLRTVCAASAAYGWPPAKANRPMTGTRPERKTTALDQASPRPLLSNQPLMHTPFAWLRRNPGCSPFTCSKRLTIVVGDKACGLNQPPAHKNKPATAAMITPTIANRRIKLPPDNGGGTCPGTELGSLTSIFVVHRDLLANLRQWAEYAWSISVQAHHPRHS